jgi:hypothetical protein
MKFKGTLVLLIVCLAFGGFLYFYEIKGGEEREKAKQAENQTWKIEGKDIQQIDLVSPDQHITAVRKNEKEWTLTAPRPLDADSDEINRLAGSASSIRREGVVEQNAANLAKFGLSPAEFSLELRTKDGKEYAIDFGNDNPTGSSTYAAIRNKGEVFLVSKYAASDFNKQVDDLRSHSVLSFEQPEVQSLSLRSPKGDLALVKDSNDRWWFDGKEKRAADSPEIRGILNALSMGRIKEFFNQNPKDYVNLGLDKPFIDVRIIYGKDKAIKHLVIGSEKSEIRKKSERNAAIESMLNPSSSKIYLAKDESRPDLFFVEKDLVDKLIKSPDDVRDKALASFQRWDIDSIELTNSKGSFSFTKSGGEWFLGKAKKKAKWDAVNGILDAMEKPVKEWIDTPAPLSKYGLDKPSSRIILKQGSNPIIDCVFGNTAKDGIYAKVKGDSSVKVADPDGIDVLDKGESDYIEAPAADAPKK